MGNLSKQGSAMLSNFLSLVSGDEQALTATQEFIGTWEVSDSNGDLFEITLFGSGSAEADRAGEGLSGTWTVDGSTAVVTWDTGWTTKITRTGETYTKTAYDQTSTAPTNTSTARKVRDLSVS
jgi:hypothetical protein